MKGEADIEWREEGEGVREKTRDTAVSRLRWENRCALEGFASVSGAQQQQQ